MTRDKIVWLACQVWQAKDAQADREQEYWRKARQLLASSQLVPAGPARSSK